MPRTRNPKGASSAPKPPTLEEILQTADPLEQARRVSGLVNQLVEAQNKLDLFMVITMTPSGQGQLVVHSGMGFEDQLRLLDMARNSITEARVRRDLEAKQKESPAAPPGPE